ncbi:MAG: Tfx family DNA-binding protein [Staphylothermus sp.]|nr:Tfx family DNA-binding protein [Staphylothermus sp.]
MSEKYGLLTELQVKTLYYRERGESFRETSAKIGTSHQNIAVAYRRALKNIEKAERTILVYRIITSRANILIKKDNHLADIPRFIIEECDKRNIKLRSDFTLLYKKIHFKCGNAICGQRLCKDLFIIIDKQGYPHTYNYNEIKDLIDSLKKILDLEIVVY